MWLGCQQAAGVYDEFSAVPCKLGLHVDELSYYKQITEDHKNIRLCGRDLHLNTIYHSILATLSMWQCHMFSYSISFYYNDSNRNWLIWILYHIPSLHIVNKEQKTLNSFCVADCKQRYVSTLNDILWPSSVALTWYCSMPFSSPSFENVT